MDLDECSMYIGRSGGDKNVVQKEDVYRWGEEEDVCVPITIINMNEFFFYLAY